MRCSLSWNDKVVNTNLFLSNRLPFIELLLIFILASTNVQAKGNAPLAIMFTSGWDPDAIGVVVEHLQDIDYAGPPIQNKTNKQAISFSLAASLDVIEAKSGRNCPINGQNELIVYDPEEWEQTPVTEQQDLPGSIKRAAAITHKKSCFKFGIAPSGQYVGRRNCKAKPNSLATSVDWTKVDVFIIQAQGMLSSNCGGIKNVRDYSRFISEWAKIVKPINPNIKVMGHFSLRHSPPETIYTAIAETRDVVDGYYLAYPKIEGKVCKYCTPENLNDVINAIRDRSPVNAPPAQSRHIVK
jgi:hypothetical protein